MFQAQALSTTVTEKGLQWFCVLQEVKSINLPAFLQGHYHSLAIFGIDVTFPGYRPGKKVKKKGKAGIKCKKIISH